MCVICVSKKGVQQPDRATLAQMFTSNPDGAGYMTARDGKVQIHKGFMTFNDFIKAVEAENFTAADPVVYHFRISTQAGVTPFMTHPFPLTSNLSNCRALDVKCKCGVVHNGIIRMTTDPRDRVYNDTARFITKYLVKILRKPADLHDDAIAEIIEALTNSKFAIMDGDGDIMTVGRFIEDNGLLFSNLTYLYHNYFEKFTYKSR